MGRGARLDSYSTGTKGPASLREETDVLSATVPSCISCKGGDTVAADVDAFGVGRSMVSIVVARNLRLTALV